MIQQVNLYQGILLQKDKNPYIIFYLLGLLLLILLLICLAFYLTHNLKNKKQQLKLTQQTLTAEKTRVKLIRAKIPKQEIDKTLIAELEKWQNNMSKLREGIKLLGVDDKRDTQGFSVYFKALGKQSLSSVWLTKIYFNKQKSEIILKGKTFKPAQLALFLQRLQQETVFQGHSFAQLQMQESEKIPKLIHFKLSTIAEVADEKK